MNSNICAKYLCGVCFDLCLPCKLQCDLRVTHLFPNVWRMISNNVCQRQQTFVNRSSICEFAPAALLNSPSALLHYYHMFHGVCSTPSPKRPRHAFSPTSTVSTCGAFANSPVPFSSPAGGVASASWTLSPVPPSLVDDDLAGGCGDDLGENTATSPDADLAGVLPAHGVCLTMLKRLPMGLRGFLQRNLRALVSLSDVYPSGIPTGSACSGSDLVTPALAMLLKILYSEKLDLVDTRKAPSVDVRWACENVPVKQRWLLEAMGVPVVFQDIADLKEPFALTSTDETVSVDDIFFHSCGFSCKSVSSQNPNAICFVGCLGQGTGKTGQTYQHNRSFIRRRLPIVVLLENVKGLSAKDRRRVVRDLRAMGYDVAIVESDVAERGVPVSRVRVWFVAVLWPSKDLRREVLNTDEVQTMAEAVEMQTRVRDLYSLPDFLEDDDGTVEMILSNVGKDKKGEKSERQGTRWVHRHKRAWKAYYYYYYYYY